MSNERSAEFCRGAKYAIERLYFDWPAKVKLIEHYATELATAEAREGVETKGIASWLTDNHVRTKDGKLCCVEVRRPDTHGGMACTWKMKDFDIQAEMDGCEAGEEIVLRYIELTDAEFTALGDFDGW